MRRAAIPPFPTPREAHDRLNESEFRRLVQKAITDINSSISELPMLVVTDAPFNATGDGTTDDTAAFQAALDAGYDLGGAIVFAPAPAVAYMISQIQRRSNVHLVGSGWWGTTLKQIANSYTTVVTGTATAGGASTLTDSGKSWTVNAYARYTVKIVSGTGSGQTRIIASNTGTQLTTTVAWTTNPNATSHYEIEEPMDMIVPYDDETERTVVRDIGLDGNKANQITLNNGFYSAPAGPFTTNDPIDMVERVWITGCKGSGIRWSSNVRETILSRVHAHECGEWGFYLASTDNMVLNCTAESNAYSGFWCADWGTRFVGCKAFGNTLHGFHLAQPYQMLIGCHAEDNLSDGFLFDQSDLSRIDGCVANGNRGIGFHLQNTSYSVVIGTAMDNRSGGPYQQYAIQANEGTCAYNQIYLISNNQDVADSNGIDDGNEAWINGACIKGGDLLRQGALQSVYGTVAGTNTEHARWGKVGSGASGNPYYVLTLTNDTVPKGKVQGYNGTDTQVYLEMDYANSRVVVGAAGVVAMQLPSFSDATRPSPTAGLLIYSTSDGEPIYGDGSDWRKVSDGTVT